MRNAGSPLRRGGPRKQCGWSSLTLVETLSPRSVCGLELFRTQPAQVAVASRAIVEDVDVVGDVRAGQRAVLVDLLLDPFLLEAAEERFRDGIVPAVALAAHARLQAVRATEAAPRIAPELRALLRLNERAAGMAPPDRHHHGIEDELTVQRRRGGPADDQA